MEPDRDAMRHLVERVAERLYDHIESLPQQPAADVEGARELALSLSSPIPEEGEDLESLLSILFDQAIPKTFNAAGPGYLAYIPGGGLFQSAVADFLAAAVNRYTGVYAAAPALVQLELDVLKFLCELAGLPYGSGGLLTTGGSVANFTAIVAARHARLPENFLSGILYASSEVHHSVLKAARLAGFPSRNIRSIPVDREFRIEVDALASQIESDRSEGLTPFMIIGSAGTTNTGAIDDLPRLAALAQSESLWFHIDAAYGGFFLLTERGRARMRGIELADSITLDPHKAMFVPYGTGCLLVRDLDTLRAAHSETAHYMPQMQQEEGLVDFCEISSELSRDYRGLRLWFPLRLLGARQFREALDEKLDLTIWATRELESIDGIEIVAHPQLTVVAFRAIPPDGVDGDAWNAQFLDRINARQRVFLTPTRLRNQFVIRICVLSFRTHQDRMSMALEDLRSALAEMHTG